MTKRLLSFTATVIAEIEIEMGSPTFFDIETLIKNGNYTLEAPTPLDDSATLIFKEVR